MPRTKKKTPNHHPETIEKEISLLLIQMMAKESPETAQAWLELIGTIVYTFIDGLDSQSDHGIALIQTIIDKYHSDKGASLFSVSATTVNQDLCQFPKKDADLILSKQVDQIEGKLRKEGLWASNELVAIDPSDIIYRGKYHNQYTPWAYCGQKDLCKRSFKENMMYLSPGALIGSSKQALVQIPTRSERDLPPWIIQAQQLFQEERARGTKIRLFEGDREFYSALGFAFSRFGLWDSTLTIDENPRFLCPMKIWDDSVEKKWEFLLNPSPPIVEKSDISIDYYHEKFLGSFLNHLLGNKKGTKHMVPTATVAVFDAYPNKHGRYSIDWAQGQAKKIAIKLTSLPKELKVAEKDFMDYIKEKEQYKWKKGKKKASVRVIALPTYKGKRRTVFKDADERKLYHLCCQLHDRIQHWEGQKTKLCKRLMFFMLSLYENEKIEGKSDLFTNLILEYHERWAIEIGFKAIKYQFYLKTNSRSACGRHVRWIISCLTYNAWHYWRLIRAARHFKKIDPNWKPFEETLNPPIRKKYERQMHPLLTAQGYLLEELKGVLKNGIKSIIQSLL